VADSMTTTASLDFDQTMWDRGVYFALRPYLYFDGFADVKTSDTAPDQGTAVTFTITSDLAVATTALNESVDVDAVSMADTQVTLTLVEYGNAVNTTWRARATSFIPLDPIVVNVIAENAGLSLDSLARNVMQAGSNVIYATGGTNVPTSRTTVIPTNVLTGNDVRKAVAQLRGANVATWGDVYTGAIHPDVSYDFRGGTGGTNWSDPHVYSDPTGIWQGSIGTFQGVRFMETPRAPIFADAGSSTTLTDVYGTLIFGRQAIAKAFSTYDGHGPTPTVIMSPVTDKLKRFQPVAWHWYGVYGRFREAALRRIESASSIGTNS